MRWLMPGLSADSHTQKKDEHMETALRYCYHDLRLTWRESSTRIFLLMPLLFFALLQWAVPELLRVFPMVASWSGLLLDGIVLQGGLMFGFVSGFLLLDEKDLRIIPIYRVAPIPFHKLLLLKMAFPFLATFLFAAASLAWNPIHRLGGPYLLVAALHFGLITPLLGLVVAALSKNKIEGLTWFKLMDLVLVVPFLGFFLPKPWNYLLRIFPSHWGLDAIVQLVHENHAGFWIDQAVGIGLLALLLVAAISIFRRSAASN